MPVKYKKLVPFMFPRFSFITGAERKVKVNQVNQFHEEKVVERDGGGGDSVAVHV